MAVPFLLDGYNSQDGRFLSKSSNQLSLIKVDYSEEELNIVFNLKRTKTANDEEDDHEYVVVGIVSELETKDGNSFSVKINLSSGKCDVKLHELHIKKTIKDNFKLVKFVICDKNNLGSFCQYNANVKVNQAFNIFPFINNTQNDIDKLFKVTFCISQTDLAFLNECLNSLNTLKNKSSEKITEKLQELTRENWVECVQGIIVNISNCKEKIEKISNSVVIIKQNTVDRAKFARNMVEKGLDYVGSDRSLRREVRDEKNTNIHFYMIIYSKCLHDKSGNMFLSNFEYFIKLYNENENNNVKFMVVDLDVQEDLPFNMPTEVSIYIMIDKEVISENLLKDIEDAPDKNYVYCDVDRKLDIPTRKCLLQMPCPGKTCSGKTRQWFCVDCDVPIEYGFNYTFYCKCGASEIKNVGFVCTDILHGYNPAVTDSKEVHNCLEKMNPLREINLLLLGQSGVGKSTWINGICNYLIYDSLDEAKRNKIYTLIPTRFTVFDEDNKCHNIVIGEDENENTNVGTSSTQECKTYKVLYKNKMYINLIDTPGIADVRGIDQDRKHVKNILDHIRHKPNLHGICILLKPNEARLGVQFQFCIRELLTHLHMNAIENLVFCFTNSRSTSYRPGDTLPILKKLLHQVNDNISLERNRIYCFDNESYKFLCTLKKNIQFPLEETASYAASWDKSVNETNKMIEFVARLSPHDTQDTMTLNHARTIILSLTKPLAELTRNIEVNISALNERKKEISNWSKSEKELEKNLRVPKIVFVGRELGYPRTVCTAKKCVKFVPEASSQRTKIQYVQHCHPHCYLNNIIPETHPNEGLKGCWAMSPGGHTCHECRCTWDKHMHFLYEIIEEHSHVTDHQLDERLKSKVSFREKKELVLHQMEERIENYKKEKNQLLKISAQFGHFLKKNAITPYNDSLLDYLNYLIDQEKNKPEKTAADAELLKQLEETRLAYTAEVEMFENVVNSPQNVTTPLDPKDIEKLEQSLYDLELTGPQLQQTMKIVFSAQNKHAEFNNQQVGAKSKSQGQRNNRSNKKGGWKGRGRGKRNDKDEKGFFNKVKDFFR